MKLSVKEFAEKHKIEYGVASGFIGFLKSKGLVKEVEKRPQPSGKGKPSIIYEIPSSVTIVISLD